MMDLSGGIKLMASIESMKIDIDATHLLEECNRIVALQSDFDTKMQELCKACQEFMGDGHDVYIEHKG